MTPEEAVVAAVLVDGSCYPRISDRLKNEDFQLEKNGLIWESFAQVVQKGQPIEILTVHAQLKETGNNERAGGFSYLSELTSGLPDPANIEHYAELVYNESGKRQLLKMAMRLASRATGPDNLKDVLSDIQGDLLQMAVRGDPMGAVSSQELVSRVVKQLEEASRGRRNDVQTGYYDLDRILIGMDPEDLVILAAATSRGKTALAINIAANVCKRGGGVYFASLEMSGEAIIKRVLAREGHINHRWFRQSDCAPLDFWTGVTKAQDSMAGWKLWIDSTAALAPADLLARCRRVQSRQVLSLVVVDYLQLMTAKGDSLYHQVTAVSHALKGVAKSLKVPVLALSQLSRDAVKEKRRPNLADLRESGAIEQDADVVMFIHPVESNPSAGTATVDVIVDKHRNGGTGTAKLVFFNDQLRFESFGDELP